MSRVHSLFGAAHCFQQNSSGRLSNVLDYSQQQCRDPKVTPSKCSACLARQPIPIGHRDAVPDHKHPLRARQSHHARRTAAATHLIWLLQWHTS